MGVSPGRRNCVVGVIHARGLWPNTSHCSEAYSYTPRWCWHVHPLGWLCNNYYIFNLFHFLIIHKVPVVWANQMSSWLWNHPLHAGYYPSIQLLRQRKYRIYVTYFRTMALFVINSAVEWCSHSTYRPTNIPSNNQTSYPSSILPLHPNNNSSHSPSGSPTLSVLYSLGLIT